MAIAWVLRKPEITSALIGASRVSQITDVVAALEKTAFTDEELQTIDDILK
jgi:L-glyceraldehyde 3-phosphate reductase